MVEDNKNLIITTQRIGYVDRLKGMTILSVVIGHIYIFCYGSNEAFMFRCVASFEMYLFLFLSGMVIISPPTLSKVKKRAIRYLVPSIIIGTITTLLIYGTSNINDWGAFLFRRLYWPASGYWYLVVLTIFNVSLLLHRLNTKNRIFIDFIIAAFWYVLFYGLWKKGGEIGAALCMEHCTCFYPFFILGHLLRKHYFMDRFATNERLLSVCIVVGCVLFFFQTGHSIADNIINRFIIPFCAIVVFVIFFRKRAYRNSKVEKLFTFYGNNSLDIYMWHFVILHNINLRNLRPVQLELCRKSKPWCFSYEHVIPLSVPFCHSDSC